MGLEKNKKLENKVGDQEVSKGQLKKRLAVSTQDHKKSEHEIEDKEKQLSAKDKEIEMLTM